MGYRYSEEGPTADLMVEAWGDTLEEAFGCVATAMFNSMTPIEGITASETRSFEVEGDDLGGLLFNFLDELLYIHEVELIVFSGFDLAIDQDRNTLNAVCSGESFEVGRHEQGIAIKAVTFHNMLIEKAEPGWKVRVVLDT